MKNARQQNFIWPYMWSKLEIQKCVGYVMKKGYLQLLPDQSILWLTDYLNKLWN